MHAGLDPVFHPATVSPGTQGLEDSSPQLPSFIQFQKREEALDLSGLPSPELGMLKVQVEVLSTCSYSGHPPAGRSGRETKGIPPSLSGPGHSQRTLSQGPFQAVRLGTLRQTPSFLETTEDTTSWAWTNQRTETTSSLRGSGYAVTRVLPTL